MGPGSESKARPEPKLRTGLGHNTSKGTASEFRASAADNNGESFEVSSLSAFARDVYEAFGLATREIEISNSI
ncbi:hypothetical protein EVAR_4102_1 [Eumeta japonica]|uniref:Uncharacterized protein n=1 Tax=Eumeta variegata TaxID=151549 RepID=A0A4C1T415_EUMVA|nr:hypothetical protein EVAR_4102_1 [Eumeta japonica]